MKSTVNGQIQRKKFDRECMEVFKKWSLNLESKAKKDFTRKNGTNTRTRYSGFKRCWCRFWPFL